jgi:signal transduction histidine kinase
MSYSESRNLVSPLPTVLAPHLPLGDLLALGPQLHADITPEELLRELAETLHRVVPSPMVYVRLRHPDTDVLEAVACVGVPAALQEYLTQTPVAPTFYQLLLQPQFRVSDSFLLPANQNIPYEPDIARYVAGLDVTEPSWYQADMLLVPLRSHGDRLLGVIYIMIPEVQSFQFANIQVLEAFVRQAALALENVRLADRGARLLAKEQLLAHLGRDVSSTLDLDIILERTITRLELAFNSGSIALFDAPGLLHIVAAVGGVSRAGSTACIKQGEGIVGSVAEYGQPYFSNNTESSASNCLLNPKTDVTIALGGCLTQARSYIAVPLLSGGKVIGTINVGNADIDAFSYEDVDLLEAIAAQISGPVNSALLYQESRCLAEQVQRRADQLTVLNTLARIATATLNMEQMLTEVTEQIQHGFGYDHVELYLVDEATREIIRQAQSGRYPSTVVSYRQHISLGILGRTVRTGQTQRVDDVRHDAEYLAIDRPDMRSELCVPIVTGGRVLGLLNLETEAVAAFTKEDVSVLHTAADILAGAIENARLYQRSQEAAVLEERNRLARELHDSVTQQLFSMTLTSQAARAQLEKNPPRAAAQLERLQETSAAALAEMRALIFQLRPPALSDQGLIPGLQQHIAALSRREGLRIELSASGDERMARGYEQALYRIVQEALNNVVKHAQATHVRVLLEFKPEQLHIRVIDNGQGFDPHAQHAGADRQFGLISMRERAAEIGGTMELQSAPGQGTEVIVTVLRNSTA